jgi:hypothetical protein
MTPALSTMSAKTRVETLDLAPNTTGLHTQQTPSA